MTNTVCVSNNSINVTTFQQERAIAFQPESTYFSNNFIYESTVAPIGNFISKAIGQGLFFSYNHQKVIKSFEQIHEREVKVAQDYWDPSIHFLNFKGHKKVQEIFEPPKELTLNFEMSLPGQEDPVSVKFPVLVIETKAKEGKPYNFVRIGGTLASSENDIAGIHPYLSSFAKSNPTRNGRFVILTGNDLNTHFAPNSLNEASFIFAKALEALNDNLGKTDLLVAHSLGSILLSNALKYIDDPSLFPEHTVLDRGPLSLYKVSLKYGDAIPYKIISVLVAAMAFPFSIPSIIGGLARSGIIAHQVYSIMTSLGRTMLYPLASSFGWDLDLEEAIENMNKKLPNATSFTIVNTRHDHYFPEGIGLSSSSTLNKTCKVFDFALPYQKFHPNAHHNIGADTFNRNNLLGYELEGDTNSILPNETLSDYLIRTSTEEAIAS